jgi:putative membrane fusion protein
MKRSRASTLFTIVFFAAMAVYIFYQVTANLTRQIRTVDALEVTVEDKISARGYFIRQQKVLSGNGSGTAEYLVQDGDKVSRGQKLAVFFQGDSARQAYDQARQLEERLAALEYAYSMITSGVDSVKMDRLIFDSVAGMGESLARGEAAKVTADYSALQQLVVSRGATEDDKEAFEGQIAALKKEIAGYQKAYSGGSDSLRAPDAGYFTGGLDGFETVLTYDRLDTLTPDELQALQPEHTAGVGSLTTEFNWYYAVVLPKAQADLLQKRDSLEVYFPELSADKLTLSVHRLETVGEEAILILKCKRMEAMFLTAREQDIDIVCGTYSGLKVPSQALRQQEGKWGVFVLDGNVAAFKPVTWNYSTDSYFLVPAAASSKEGLFRYDRVIVQGRDLADNKVIR